MELNPSDIRLDFLLAKPKVVQFLTAASNAHANAEDSTRVFDWVLQPSAVKNAVAAIAGPDGDLLVDLLSIWNELGEDDRTLVASLVEARTSLAKRRTFGGKLKWLRRGAGWTQRELAAKAGVPYATVRDIEQGVICKPSFADAVNLARAFGKSVAVLSGVQVWRSGGRRGKDK